MRRFLEPHIKKDLSSKIVLLAGPRQCGKTTLARQLGFKHEYLNFDDAAGRKIIFAGEWDRTVDLVIFDEIHKMKKWKSWIKGVFDTEGVSPKLLLTGSSRLDVYRKGGDSLAGRYFLHRLHPFTVKEVISFSDTKDNARDILERMMTISNFPEPFIKNDAIFAKRWRKSHMGTILREDLLDLEKVRDIKSIEIMADMLRSRVGSEVSHSSLAQDLQVSVPTVKHWLAILENLCVIFPVRPYSRNIARSLLKASKYYFYDTGAVEGDLGAKLENAVAAGLLAELQFHEDTTGDKASLCYLRDKDKREVDFLTVINNIPRHMVEVKLSDEAFSKHLFHFKSFFKEISCYQLAYQAKHRKSNSGVNFVSAHEFLADFTCGK